LVAEENRLAGIFTERDALRLTASRADLAKLLIAEVMTHSVVTLTLSESQNIFTALSLMRQHRICHLPIVDEEGQLLGLVTQTNLLQVFDFLNLERSISAWLQRDKEQNAKLGQVNQELQKTKELLRQSDGRQILELEEANQLLEQRDRQWQALFDNALDAIAIADDEGCYVDVNPAACALFGISKEELLHKRVADFADPNLDMTGVWQQFLQQGQQKGEFSLHRPDGRVVETEFAAVTNFIPHRHLSVLRDINNRKQAEAKLKENEARLKLALEANHTGIWDWNIPENKIIWSENLESLFGLAPGTFDGRFETFINLVHPEDRELVRQAVMGAVRDKRDYELQFRVILPNDKIRWRADKGKVFYDSTDKPIRMIGLHTDITARKELELSLQASEAKLSRILDSAIVAISSFRVYANRDWEYEYWSAGCERLYGYALEDYADKYFWMSQVFPDDREQILMPLFDDFFAERDATAEYRFRRKDGSMRWFSSSYSSQKIGEDCWIVTAVNHDISEAKHRKAERKRAEQALRESEAKASSLTNDVIDKSPVGMFILDAHFRVVWLNQTLAKFFGLKKEDAIGQDKRQLIRQRIAQIFESPELFTKRVLDTYDNNTYIEKFECHVLPDGSREERWLEHLSQPIHSGLYAGGRIEHYTDITERKLSEQKIREQATLIDIASDAIFVRDLDNRILFWNKGAERLYGWTAEEVIAQKAHELFTRESSSQLEEGLNITLEQGSWQGELEQITKTGKEIIVASRWSLVRDESGQPQSILVVNTDITEKKQLEMQFFRAQRLESLGTLAGGIAHDLNNIFTPILGIAQLLPLQLSSSDPEIENLLKILQTSAKRGSALVQQILSFARGGEEEEFQLVQIKHLLWEVKNFVQQTLPKSIAVEAHIPKNLWTVRADPTQLHQVLMNLCVNARDAMSDGGTLSISAANQFLDEQYVRLNLEAKVEPYLVITVSDTGTGIPPEIVERIFDPFFTTKELGQGTGLGLSTVMGIIKAHGGFITVRSEVGRGSQFQVYLPAAETEQTEPEAKQDLLGGERELILLVDDEAEIREITKKTLETYNYRVLTASDGIEAIAVYAQDQDRIDAVLLDLMMPQMDGLTAMRTLHKINPNIKMIAVSGVTTKERTAAATEIGSQAFLAKPYRTEELLLTLRSVICNS
jgi:PAS domain S-box-containing protein